LGQQQAMTSGTIDAPKNKRAQLGLDLSVRRRDYRRSNFVVTPANAAALALAEEFLRSDETALAVTGPAGSGKTHFLHLIGEEPDVAVTDARAIAALDGRAPLALVDNAERAVPKDLLALVELTRAAGGKIAIAGAGAPVEWAQGLRDLETRLSAMARVSLEEPDEDLLRAVIAQRFRERQWRAAETVPEFVAPRIPRTFAAAEAFVDAVGAAAIAEGKPISLPLARKTVENLFLEDPAP